jgi:DNA-binding response OmpR family regulator
MAERPTRILLADDEQSILTLLSYPLRQDGYEVVRASSGVEALERFEESEFDLVVLDVMMPHVDGLEVVRRMRATSTVPIIMLTAKTEEIDKVLGLELGADDYVTKPFALHEFLARVKARLRRQSSVAPGHDEAIALGEIVLDPSRQQLTVRGNAVALAPKEFGLLRVLMENQGRVVTRQTLLDKVWGYDFEGEQQTVSVHIRWLREKIEEDSRAPRHILTVRSRGYMFKA